MRRPGAISDALSGVQQRRVVHIHVIANVGAVVVTDVHARNFPVSLFGRKKTTSGQDM